MSKLSLAGLAWGVGEDCGWLHFPQVTGPVLTKGLFHVCLSLGQN